MFIRKWSPLFAPDLETGAADDTVDDAVVGGADEGGSEEQQHDGPGSGRSNIRKQLEKSFDDDRRSQERQERQEKREAGRFGKGRHPAEGEEGAEVDPKVDGQEGTEGQEAKPAEVVAAPEGFSKEAKAEWAKVPAAVQQAVLKREADTAKGVQELKQRYNELDKVLQPRLDVIRKNGHTPAQAVNQLWLWFEALSGNPDQAFPALAQSFGYDLKRFAGVAEQKPAAGVTTPAAAEAGKEGQAAEAAVPPQLQQYIDDLKKEIDGLKGTVTEKFGNLEQNYAKESQSKTDEMVGQWSNGKPHFEAVRETMGQMLMVLAQQQKTPVLANGAIDLDKIYDMAIYANPEVRALVLKEQQDKVEADRRKAAEKEVNARQQEANRARKATGSLAPAAPGAKGTPAKKAPGKGKTVGESLRESIAELSEQQ